MTSSKIAFALIVAGLAWASPVEFGIDDGRARSVIERAGPGKFELVDVVPRVSRSGDGSDPGVSVVRGAQFTARLVAYPERLRDRFRSIEDLFVATPDSAAWFGPNRPNPHSWLSESVYCRDVADFRIDVAACDGERLESLRFSGVKPGFYRLVVEPEGEMHLRRFEIRFYQGETLVHEASYCPPGENAGTPSEARN